MFKIYTRLEKDGEWGAVIDVAQSRSHIVERIFMNENEVEGFKRTALEDFDEENIKVEAVVDTDSLQ